MKKSEVCIYKKNLPSKWDFFVLLSLSSSVTAGLESPIAEIAIEHNEIVVHFEMKSYLNANQEHKTMYMLDLRFKNVSARMKRTLKRRENPRSAPMQIQYQYSSTKRPRPARRVFPTVGWLDPLMGCAK